MKFTEHRDISVLTVKNYQPGEVKVNDMIFTESFYMTQKTYHENWPCKSIDELSIELLDRLLEEKPEVIILGTGEQQHFPDPKLFVHCTSKGIGLEVMTNDAACRTYDVLTTEDRDVVLALILEPIKSK